MANARIANKIFVDSTGSIVTNTVKVTYILFTPGAASDELTLRETADGPDCFHVRGATAHDTLYYRFDVAPLVFSNGIYVQTITSGAKAVIVTSMAGGN